MPSTRFYSDRTQLLVVILVAIGVCFTIPWIQYLVKDIWFYQTSVTMQATVIDRRVAQYEQRDSEGDTFTVSTYYITYRFQPEEARNPVIREEQVPFHLYFRLPAESRVTVRYLPSTPNEATIRGILERPNFLADICFVPIVDAIAFAFAYIVFIGPAIKNWRLRRRV